MTWKIIIYFLLVWNGVKANDYSGNGEQFLVLIYLYLNYYLSGAVFVSARLSVCVCVCLRLSVRKNGFGEQTSRVLEFKPEGFEGLLHTMIFIAACNMYTFLHFIEHYKYF